MKYTRMVVVATALMVLGPCTYASAAGAPTWRTAQKVVLPSGGIGLPQGYLPALSCATPGNCTAAGAYSDNTGNTHGLTLREVGGVWRPATAIAPPAGATSIGLTPYAVSCATPGNCSVVGAYRISVTNVQPFALIERSGIWKPTSKIVLPKGALVAGQSAALRAVACSSSTSCVGVGIFTAGSASAPRREAFVAREVAGVWRAATLIAVPTNANLNPYVSLSQLACPTVTSCVAAGTYIDANNVTRGLLLTTTGPTWSAHVITPPVNASIYATMSVGGLSCASAGNCTVLGTYVTAQGATQAFIESESNGRWARALPLTMPNGAAPNPHVFLYNFTDISCRSVGNCSAGGQYRDSAGNYQGFLVNQRSGTWQSATTLALPSGAVSTGKNGGVVSVSCSSAGECSAGAAYLDSAGNYQALVVNASGSTWRSGVKIGLPKSALTVGVDGGVYSLVCHVGGCSGVGSYLSSPTLYAGFTLAAN